MVIICSLQPGLICSYLLSFRVDTGGWIYAELEAIIKGNHVWVEYTDISIQAPWHHMLDIDFRIQLYIHPMLEKEIL